MQQCGEAIWLTPNATVASGSVSNIFVVRNGTLFTPTARGEEGEDEEPSAVLPGVTRQAVISLADDLGIGTSKATLTFDDVLGGAEKRPMPPLLRTYLAMGGWVSDHAVIDRALHTLHVLTVVEIAKIPPARAKALRAFV